MRVVPQAIPDVYLITPEIHYDARGFFYENFHADKLAKHKLYLDIKQENISYSRQHTLRGMHYQRAPYAQSKWVQVLSGCIFDVAIDIRPESPYYLKWVSAILSDENRAVFAIPKGFAHGFYVMSTAATVLYKCDAVYHPESEGRIRWDDPRINIQWPLTGTPVLSPQDLAD